VVLRQQRDQQDQKIEFLCSPCFSKEDRATASGVVSFQEKGLLTKRARDKKRHMHYEGQKEGLWQSSGQEKRPPFMGV